MEGGAILQVVKAEEPHEFLPSYDAGWMSRGRMMQIKEFCVAIVSLRCLEMPSPVHEHKVRGQSQTYKPSISSAPR